MLLSLFAYFLLLLRGPYRKASFLQILLEHEGLLSAALMRLDIELRMECRGCGWKYFLRISSRMSGMEQPFSRKVQGMGTLCFREGLDSVDCGMSIEF